MIRAKGFYLAKNLGRAYLKELGRWTWQTMLTFIQIFIVINKSSLAQI